MDYRSRPNDTGDDTNEPKANNHIALKGFEPISLYATLGHCTLTDTWRVFKGLAVFHTYNSRFNTILPRVSWN